MADPFRLPRHHREKLGEASRELRRDQTDTEERFWQAVRNRRLRGYRFRRQHRVGPFIADFFCFESRLIVEIDGAIHDDHQEYDAERDEILNQAGYRTLRVTAADVESDLPEVLSKVLHACRSYHRTAQT